MESKTVDYKPNITTHLALVRPDCSQSSPQIVGVLRADQRSNLLTKHDSTNIAVLVQVEDDDGQIVIFA
jgi:hypothetical protein